MVGGCSAVPGAEQERELPTVQITLEGTVAFRGWRRRCNLCCKRSDLPFPLSLIKLHSWISFLHSQEDFAAHAQVSVDWWKLWVTRYAGTEALVAASFIFHLDLVFFFNVHPVVCTYVYTAESGCFSCCSVWDKRGRCLLQVRERIVGEARMVISLVVSNASCPSVPLANLLSMCPHQVWYRAVAAPEFFGWNWINFCSRGNSSSWKSTVSHKGLPWAPWWVGNHLHHHHACDLDSAAICVTISCSFTPEEPTYT